MPDISEGNRWRWNAAQGINSIEETMVKVIDIGMESSYIMQHASYTCKETGNAYHFDRGVGTEVKDKKDIEFFRRGGFHIVSAKKAVVSKVVGKDAVKEEIAKARPEAKTEKEIYALNRDAQKNLIRKLGGSNTRIPPLEKDRVALILKLQGNVEAGG